MLVQDGRRRTLTPFCRGVWRAPATADDTGPWRPHAGSSHVCLGTAPLDLDGTQVVHLNAIPYSSARPASMAQPARTRETNDRRDIILLAHDDWTELMTTTSRRPDRQVRLRPSRRLPRPSGATAVAMQSAKVWSAVAGLCLIQFVDVMSVTVVITALPAVLADVGARPADGTLVATGYAMFFGGLLMFGARVGDRVGHKRCILVSLTIFACGALLAATATSTLEVVAARCIQGASAAAAVPSALSLLTSVARDGRERASAVAAWSAAGAAAGASGFVLGGIVTQFGSWRVIFWGLLVVAIVQAVAVVAFVPPSLDHKKDGRPTLNVGGSLLFTAAIMLVVIGTSLLGEQAHRLEGGLLLGAATAVAGLFAAVDRRSAAPLLPRAVWVRPQVLRGTTGAFVNTAVTTSAATLIILYLQGTLGRGPLEAAVTLLPFSVFVVAGSAAAARLIVRRRKERIIALGLALVGIGIALPMLDPAWAVLVGAGMAVAGLGLGLSSVAATSMGTDVPEELRATSSGIVNTSAQLGAAIGTAALLLLAAATTGVPDRTAGTPVVAWAAAAVFGVVAAAAFALLKQAARAPGGGMGTRSPSAS